jgi:Ca2+-binding RTX toxin-like protein
MGGQDQFTGINSVNGTGFADKFKGGAGNQRFVGFGGNDTFEGGSGNSEVDYRLEARALGRTAGVTVDLGTGTTVTVKDTSGFTDTLINIKRIRGTDFADRISGNGFDNRLRGDAGNDTLKGGAGNDRLEGGAGTDTAVFSGSRSDYIVTTSLSGEVVVTDTRAGADGFDVLTDVETFQFGQTSVSLDQLLNNGTGVSVTGGAVNENSATGAAIGTLSVTNRDAASTHTFMLLNDAGGRFRLVDGNKIEVADGGIRLDYEQAKSHKIEVLAIDQFGNGVSQTLTISVRNVATEIVTGTEGSNVLVTGSGADKLYGGEGNDTLTAGRRQRPAERRRRRRSAHGRSRAGHPDGRPGQGRLRLRQQGYPRAQRQGRLHHRLFRGAGGQDQPQGHRRQRRGVRGPDLRLHRDGHVHQGGPGPIREIRRGHLRLLQHGCGFRRRRHHSPEGFGHPGEGLFRALGPPGNAVSLSHRSTGREPARRSRDRVRRPLGDDHEDRGEHAGERQAEGQEGHHRDVAALPHQAHGFLVILWGHGVAGRHLPHQGVDVVEQVEQFPGLGLLPPLAALALGGLEPDGPGLETRAACAPPGGSTRCRAP